MKVFKSQILKASLLETELQDRVRLSCQEVDAEANVCMGVLCNLAHIFNNF